MKGSYTMSVNRAKKELNITIVGNFSNEQALQYINDYNSKVKSINPTEYTLRLDCTDLNVVTSELVEPLEACYALYKSSNFSKVIFEISKIATVKMQLQRMARKVGLTVQLIEV